MSLSLIVLFPLIGFLLNGALQMRASKRGVKSNAMVSGVIATGAMALSFIVAVLELLRLRALPVDGRLFEETVFQWITLGKTIQINFALRWDTLSSVFTMVITGVGTLIHLYSIGYMSKDQTPARYFSYLNLFCVMMLILVLGTSLPLVFLGWEGVGLASYLLIGYWYQDFAKVKAGQKAFIMNRIGDLGFLIAMFVAFQYAGTLDLLQINQFKFEPAIATSFGLLIFFACTGKSAQIPLFTWLPDAMAGPTPVSALIHAATMVTSGIYLLSRLGPTIASSAVTLSVIAIVGAVTAFVAATIACAQSDIKKILAYSTVSQLGFMFLACGVAAFDAAVFHVMTHAFFKALLFLAAGSVIHALHEEQDIFNMGDLRKKLPLTFIAFAAGWAAIIGVPLFSGFFSKDEIIFKSLSSPYGGVMLFTLALASALLTAFYMTRLLILVFFSTDRVPQKSKAGLHESPRVMTLPLLVLAFLSLVGGWLGSPIASTEEKTAGHATEWIVMFVCVLLSAAGAFVAYRKYEKFNRTEKANAFLANAWGIDAFYTIVFEKGVPRLSRDLWRFIEENVFQRSLRWAGSMVQLTGTIVRSVQVGSVQAYLMMMILLLTFILFLLTYGIGQYGKL